MDVPFIVSVLFYLLFHFVVAWAVANEGRGNIRRSSCSPDPVPEFEIVHKKVRRQVSSEISNNNNNTQISDDTQRPGHATRTHRCNEVDQQIPSHLTFITKYPFYSKYTHAYGIPVVASSAVSDKAVKKACYIVRFLFADRHDIRENMYKYFGRVAVVGRHENLTQIPEYSHLPDWWNRRSRGLGGTLDIPLSCGGEENLLCLEEDRSHGDDIFFHETAHAVSEIGIRGGPNGDLDGIYFKLHRSYNNAKRKGLWKGTYSMFTVREYFAEGVQSFFNCHISVYPPDGIHNNISTRVDLNKYDPDLYKILEEVFPCKNNYSWCYEGTPPDLVMDCEASAKQGLKPTQRQNPVSKGEDCLDKNTYCSIWSRDGYCRGKYEEYMRENCKETCNLCSSMMSLPTTTPACVDKHKNCKGWADEGFCTGTYWEYMETNCWKSCFCSS